MLTTVEKVIFLQDIDILALTPTEDLARIAAITDEITLEKDQVLFREKDRSDALYIVVEGEVRLDKEGQLVMMARTKDAFGTWSLFDDELRVVTATAVAESRLLRINKEDFIDLLADHVQITQSILKTLAKKLRSLMARTRM